MTSLPRARTGRRSERGWTAIGLIRYRENLGFGALELLICEHPRSLKSASLWRSSAGAARAVRRRRTGGSFMTLLRLSCSWCSCMVWPRTSRYPQYPDEWQHDDEEHPGGLSEIGEVVSYGRCRRRHRPQSRSKETGSELEDREEPSPKVRRGERHSWPFDRGCRAETDPACRPAPGHGRCAQDPSAAQRARESS